LVLSQVYVPDPASVGQHMHDAAAELASRGVDVRVLASARGYDDPTRKYEAREVRDGVDIRRLPLSSFGKASIPVRLLGAGLFMLQCIWHGLTTPRLGGILVSTSPPMAAMAALLVAWLRGVPITYWVMDLNPDQMVELGKLRAGSLPVKLYDAFNRRILRRAHRVVALDRFMAERLLKKADVSNKLDVMPPWPHEDALESIKHDENPFRAEHGLDGKFVVMYSGNHGFSTPVTTVLQAALRMQDREDIVFMFIGGGVGKREVDAAIAEHQPANIVSLPYQPMERLRYSLSAADVHLVSVGNDVVGVVHPCKVYGAMAVGRPILLLGPRPCHVSDMVGEHNLGWQIAHGDIDGAVATIADIAASTKADRAAMGARARTLIDQSLSKAQLCGRFCDVVMQGLRPARGQAQAPVPALKGRPAMSVHTPASPDALATQAVQEPWDLPPPGRPLRKYVFIQDDPFYLPKVLDKYLREHAATTAGVNIQSVQQGKRTVFQTAMDLYKLYGFRYFQWKLRNYAWRKIRAKLPGSSGAQLSVASVARKYGVPVHGAADVNSVQFRGMLRQEGVEFIVSISGTQLYRKALRGQTSYGIVNCHGALLPKYRGLMPSFWTLANGEKEGGVSVHYVDAKLDNGPIITQKRYTIHPHDTLEDIMARGKDLAAEAILEAVRSVEYGPRELLPNPESEMTHFSMPTRKDVARLRGHGHRLS
jgi:folate-dependent phosphoribosylglycinamide formyltransferase PurN/glycosyltransferase involved in cell wall biosynthesis